MFVTFTIFCLVHLFFQFEIASSTIGHVYLIFQDDKNHISKIFKLVLVFSVIVTFNFAPRLQIPLLLGKTVNI